MHTYSSVLAIIVGLLAPCEFSSEATEAPPEEKLQVAKTPSDTKANAEATPTCALTFDEKNGRLAVDITATSAAFEGIVRLDLLGRGFRHQDQRPITVAAGETKALPLPDVRLPRDLNGDLTVVNTQGHTVCNARL